MPCRSDEYHLSKSEMQGNLSFPNHLFLPLIPPFLSTHSLLHLPPSFSVFLCPISLHTSPSSPFANADLILSHYNDLRFSFSCCPALKPSRRSKPCFSSYCRQTARQPLKMASTLHTALQNEVQKLAHICAARIKYLQML